MPFLRSWCGEPFQRNIQKWWQRVYACTIGQTKNHTRRGWGWRSKFSQAMGKAPRPITTSSLSPNHSAPRHPTRHIPEEPTEAHQPSRDFNRAVHRTIDITSLALLATKPSRRAQPLLPLLDEIMKNHTAVSSLVVARLRRFFNICCSETRVLRFTQGGMWNMLR